MNASVSHPSSDVDSITQSCAATIKDTKFDTDKRHQRAETATVPISPSLSQPSTSNASFAPADNIWATLNHRNASTAASTVASMTEADHGKLQKSVTSGLVGCQQRQISIMCCSGLLHVYYTSHISCQWAFTFKSRWRYNYRSVQPMVRYDYRVSCISDFGVPTHCTLVHGRSVKSHARCISAATDITIRWSSASQHALKTTIYAHCDLLSHTVHDQSNVWRNTTLNSSRPTDSEYWTACIHRAVVHIGPVMICATS